MKGPAVHRHISKHQKRRRADADVALLLFGFLPRGGVARFEPSGPALSVHGRVIPVRSLDAARKACRRAGMALQEPLVQRHGPTAAQIERRRLWRAAQEAAWVSRKARG